MDATDDAVAPGDPDTVYATRSLVTALLRFARDADPEEVSVALATTAAADLDVDDVTPETAVFTDFYLPAAGASIERVFGMNLSVPPGQTRGRFVSHPTGDPDLSTTDDLAPRVLVAVPPWEPENVAAFDRHGRRHRLVLLDVEPEPARLQ